MSSPNRDLYSIKKDLMDIHKELKDFPTIEKEEGYLIAARGCIRDSISSISDYLKYTK